jgi:TRAP-type transport system periplasmic protein
MLNIVGAVNLRFSAMLLASMFAFTGSASAEQTIRLGHTNPQTPQTNTAAAMSVVFKGSVEQGSRNDIKVSIFPASQLGRERELMEAVRLGTLHAIIISEGTTVNFFQPLEVLGIPYVFPSIEVAWKVVDGPFGQNMFDEFRKATGIRIIGSAPPGGFRNFGTNKPIKSASDLKGQRIRTMEHPVHQAMMTALGASPTPVAFSEVYSAVKSGIVDGLELPYAQILNMKLNEVIKHVVADEHVFNQEMLFVNDRWFSALTPANQQAVLKAGRDAQIAGRGVALVNDYTGPDQLRALGITVHYPTEQEKASFKDAAQPPVLEIMKKRVDPKWVDGLLKAVVEASK